MKLKPNRNNKIERTIWKIINYSLFKTSEFLSQSYVIFLITGRRSVEKKDRSLVCPAFPDACPPLLQHGDWAAQTRTLNLYPVSYWTCASFWSTVTFFFKVITPWLYLSLFWVWYLLLGASELSDWKKRWMLPHLIDVCLILPGYVACLLDWRVPVHLVASCAAVILQLLLSLPLFSKPLLFPLYQF